MRRVTSVDDCIQKADKWQKELTRLRQWRMTSPKDIAGAKRDETRQKRIEKILTMITAGVGLNDKYRHC